MLEQIVKVFITCKINAAFPAVIFTKIKSNKEFLKLLSTEKHDWANV